MRYKIDWWTIKKDQPVWSNRLPDGTWISSTGSDPVPPFGSGWCSVEHQHLYLFLGNLAVCEIRDEREERDIPLSSAGVKIPTRWRNTPLYISREAWEAHVGLRDQSFRPDEWTYA